MFSRLRFCTSFACAAAEIVQVWLACRSGWHAGLVLVLSITFPAFWWFIVPAASLDVLRRPARWPTDNLSCNLKTFNHEQLFLGRGARTGPSLFLLWNANTHHTVRMALREQAICFD